MHSQKLLGKIYSSDKRTQSTYLTAIFSFIVIVITAQASSSQSDSSDKTSKPVSVYINHRGEVELKTPFTSAQPFSEGLAAVEQNEKIGYIDKTGKCVIQFQFVIHKVYGSALGKDGMCRPLVGDPDVKICSFSEGLAAVPIAKDKSRRWGYINKAGEIVIPASFDNAGEFHEGVAAVRTNGAIEFVDKKGHTVISRKNTEQAIKDPRPHAPPPISTSLLSQTIKYSQGLAPFATSSGYFGYIDKKGDYIIKPEFINAHPFCEDIACVYKGHMIVKTIKRLGKEVQDYSCITDGWSFINLKGQQLFERTFAQADDFAEGLAPVKIDGKWGFINKNGQVVIKPQFDRAFPFSDGLACVQSGTKYGCINHKGATIIKPIYNRELQFGQGLAPVAELP
jgi:hypothetical protein